MHVKRASSIVLMLLLASLFIASLGAAQTQVVRWFYSPSGNIQCEVASGGAPRGTYAYCQTATPQQWARLTSNGRTQVCSGRRCNIGNGPENSFELAYGQSVRVGIFRCYSSRAGIRCVIRRTGHGFAIAREGIRRF